MLPRAHRMQCRGVADKQVDRYKALLVKQRDIMIALTARLNERDDSILGLQEELEAYDAHQKCAPESMYTFQTQSSQPSFWVTEHSHTPQ